MAADPNPPQNPPAGQRPPASLSAKGCFVVSVNGTNIKFDYDPAGDGQILPEHLDLIAEIQKTEAVLKSLFYPKGVPLDAEEPDDQPVTRYGFSQEPKDIRTSRQFWNYFNRLLDLAKLGLNGQAAVPWIAKANLASLKEQLLIQDGGRIKNRYVEKLGKWALNFATIPVLFLALRMFLKYLEAIGRGTFTWLNAQPVSIITVILYAWLGAMAGTWLSFLARNPVLTFERLATPEEDRVNPDKRLFYTGLLAVLIVSGLLMSLFRIEVGGLDSRNLLKAPALALLIGALVGLAEKTVGERLLKQADSVLK